MGEEGTPGPEGVADGRWERVRRLGERIARLEAADALGELDEEGRLGLARLRTRAARAADSAVLADALADRIAGIRRGRDQAGPPG